MDYSLLFVVSYNPNYIKKHDKEILLDEEKQ